jgi:hypothetical protein
VPDVAPAPGEAPAAGEAAADATGTPIGFSFEPPETTAT